MNSHETKRQTIKACETRGKQYAEINSQNAKKDRRNKKKKN